MYVLLLIVLLASGQNQNSTCWSVEMPLASLPLFTSHPAVPLQGPVKYKFPKFFSVTFYGLKVSNLIGDENSEQHSPNTLGMRVLPSTYELRKIYSLAHVECWGGGETVQLTRCQNNSAKVSSGDMHKDVTSLRAPVTQT